MASYPTLENENKTVERLNEMGVSIYFPEEENERLSSRTQEHKIIEAMEEFSHFVLEGRESNIQCRSIIQNDEGGTVNELQGGNDDVRIYRISIPCEEDEGEKSCAATLFRVFHSSREGKRYRSIFTASKIRQYMLKMCNRHSERMGNIEKHYSHIDNLMFILQFGGGSTRGQVRHIDNMAGNLQICLYMSTECPSTIIYEMENNYTLSADNGDESDGTIICGCTDLLRYWIAQSEQKDGKLPKLVQHILETMGDVPLKQKWYCKYFSFWGTIDLQLKTFGKLYQPVAYQHSFEKTRPGTTLIAGGNEVHAGPPTDRARMFVFGVGIPDGDEEHASAEQSDNDDNNGEVQYSPVTFHIDFCTLLFCILRHSKDLTGKEEELHMEAKLFLLTMLIELVKDYPMKDYLIQVDSCRVALISWLEELLDNLNNKKVIDQLVLNAVSSDEIFYTPEVIKKHGRRKKTRRGHIKNEATTVVNGSLFSSQESQKPISPNRIPEK